MIPDVNPGDEAVRTLPVHVVRDDTKGEKRPVEIRSAHRTIVLTSTQPYAQLVGYDPARKLLKINAFDNPIVISGDISQASDPTNLIVATASVYWINLPASGVAAYNNNNVPVQVQVGGGTVSQIAVNGVNTGVTSGFINVPANGTITVTYTVAPTTWNITGPSIGIATPNGRLLYGSATLSNEYEVAGQDEQWVTAATYPTRVSFSIFREV